MNKELREEIKEIEKLSKTETLELMKQVVNGDESAKHKLVKHNLFLLVNVIDNLAIKKIDTEIDMDELFSVGTFSMYDALNNFDFDKNTSVSSHLQKSIFFGIRNYVSSEKDKNKVNMVSFSDEVKPGVLIQDTLVTGDTTVSNVERRDLFNTVNDVVEKLRPIAKQVIRDEFWENKSIKDCALEMGKSREFVRTCRFTAYRNLRHPARAHKLRGLV